MIDKWAAQRYREALQNTIRVIDEVQASEEPYSEENLRRIEEAFDLEHVFHQDWDEK